MRSPAIDMHVTNATYRLTAELFGGRGMFGAFGRNLQSRAETIARIEAAGEPGAAFYLAIYALGAEAVLREQAARAAKALLAPLRPDDLLLLDQKVRRMEFVYDHDDAFRVWTNLSPGQLSVFEGRSSGFETLLGMFSFHQNGRVREEAVRLLAGMNGGAELPFLLIRLNDWVPSLRWTASAAVRARLLPSYAIPFAANVALLHRLLLWKRADHSSVLGWVAEYLRKPDCSAAVAELLAAPDMMTRRLLYQLLAGPGQEGLADLLRPALQDRSPTIRLWAIRLARLHLTGAEQAEMARLGIGDNYSRVRAQAAYILAEQLPEESAPIFRAALMDPAPALRAMGRFYLGRIEAVDFRAFYMARLGSQSMRERAIAIASLGDVGSAGDADLVAPCLDDPSGRIRTAALQALTRLDGDRFIDQFLLALSDEAPAVAKEAARALAKRAVLLDMEELWAQARKPHAASLRNRLLKLVFDGPKWDSLYYAVASLTHPDPQVVSMALDHMRRWINAFNKSGVQATQAQRARIMDALDRYGQLMPAGMAGTIQFLAK